MSAAPEPADLLDDVLSEDDPTDFRNALIAQTLREVRRQKVLRRVRRSAALVVCLVVGGLIWRGVRPRIIEIPPASSYTVVNTQTLPAESIVHTSGLEAELRDPAAKGVVLVRTDPGAYRPINDEELLRLLAPRPAVLIGVGSHLEILVLGSDVDRSAKPLN